MTESVGGRALRLRQVSLVTDDIAEAERLVESHLGLEVCWRDPELAALGLHQALYPVGDQFLELVTPIRTDTAAERLMRKRGGPTFFMAIFQAPDLDEHRRRLNELGVPIVWEPSKGDWSSLHLHPRAVGGTLTSIDRDATMQSFSMSGPRWRDHVRTETVTGIAGIVVESGRPDVSARQWSSVLDRPVEGHEIALDDARIRFTGAARVDGRVAAVELKRATDGDGLDEFVLCGTTVRLVR